MHKRIKKITFRKSDDRRLILTDTLPYEVPIHFSNSGFYHRLTEGSVARLKKECGLNLLEYEGFTIPFTYKIRKDSLDYRALSIVHPIVQVKFSEFVFEHAQLILGLCSRSSFSLRAPARVAGTYYEKYRASKFLVENGGVEEDKSGIDGQDKNASSFFSYRNYNLIYRFYESPEFHDLERRFNYLRTLDIAKCFPHIYTHSLSWAVRNKEFAKGNKKAITFDSKFDQLMRHSNYDETNGIVVGPEVSRVFAEVILQDVDRSIESSAELLPHPLLAGKDFAIRRYVDDYFVFAKSPSILDQIQKIVANELERYKLYLNAAKIKTSSRPFVTGQTSAKLELAHLIDKLFDKHILPKKNIVVSEGSDAGASGEVPDAPVPLSYVGNPEILGSSYIRDLKGIIARYSTTYDAITNHFFSVLRRRTLQFLGIIPTAPIQGAELERLRRFLQVVVDLAFFAFSMSPRVRATYQLCQICVAIKNCVSFLGIEASESIAGYVAEKLRLALVDNVAQSDGDNIELLSLLSVLKFFGNKYAISQSTLCEIFEITLHNGAYVLDPEKFRYFQFMALLHYMAEDAEYTPLRSALTARLVALIEEVSEVQLNRQTELVLLVLDYLKCPFVSIADKQKVGKALLRKTSDKNINSRCTTLLAIVETGNWFYAWGEDDILGAVLWKKELKPAY